MDINVSPQELTIRIARTPRTVSVCGEQVTVHELGIRLPFTRKPQSLSDVGGGGDPQRIYVTSTREMTAAEYDDFARGFLRDRDWLSGQGGVIGDARVCVELIAPGRPVLYVNAEGFGYARYVARLG
jgi:hypothetical protein